MLIWKKRMARKRLELNGSISFVRTLCPLPYGYDIYPYGHTSPKSKTDLGETSFWGFSARWALWFAYSE